MDWEYTEFTKNIKYNYDYYLANVRLQFTAYYGVGDVYVTNVRFYEKTDIAETSDLQFMGGATLSQIAYPATGELTDTIALHPQNADAFAHTNYLPLGANITYVVEFDYWADIDGTVCTIQLYEGIPLINRAFTAATKVSCYPVYGSRVPRIMREFIIRHMELFKSKKVIIFCTQMYFSGDGARAFTDIFPRDFVEIIYAEHFLMPNNVCNVFITPLPSEKTIKKYITKAERKMLIVCDGIKNGIIRKRGFNPVSRALGLIQGVFYPKLEKMGMDKVWIDNDCTQCNLCVSVCPMNNFENKDGKIISKHNCTMCYRCINQCPKKAIAVYLRGKVKKQ